jgi:carbon monoxide dehydrogenase subunit G
MKISQEFTVAQPADKVWEFFQQVPEVAQCMPGAELTEDKGDGTYGGKLSVKLGPMSSSFEGEATVTPDAAARTATIEGKGTDRRGGSRGQVKVEYRLADAPEGTVVSVDADVTLSGAAAQFGRSGLINEMSNRLIAEFVTCLEAKLGAATVEEAAEIRAGEVRGISLFFSSLVRAIVRFFKRLFGGGTSGDS